MDSHQFQKIVPGRGNIKYKAAEERRLRAVGEAERNAGWGAESAVEKHSKIRWEVCRTQMLKGPESLVWFGALGV